MDVEYIEIMTGELLLSIWVATIVLIYRSVRSSSSREGDREKGVDGGIVILVSWKNILSG